MPAATTSGNGDVDGLDVLAGRVRAKRTAVEAFVRAAVRRRQVLIRVSIVGGAIAATMTAAPAFGGQSLTDWLTTTFALAQPSWRLLCAVAAVCSLAATVATQLLKSNNLEERILRAQEARTALEVLQFGIDCGEVDRDEAVSSYRDCVERIPFVEGEAA